MFERREAGTPKQDEFWVEKDQLPAVKAGAFYRNFDETLGDIGFAGKVREVCRPAYKDASSGGRPGIDDLHVFWETDPHGYAVAERDGEVVGTVSIVS